MGTWVQVAARVLNTKAKGLHMFTPQFARPCLCWFFLCLFLWKFEVHWNHSGRNPQVPWMQTAWPTPWDTCALAWGLLQTPRGWPFRVGLFGKCYGMIWDVLLKKREKQVDKLYICSMFPCGSRFFYITLFLVGHLDTVNVGQMLERLCQEVGDVGFQRSLFWCTLVASHLGATESERHLELQHWKIPSAELPSHHSAIGAWTPMEFWRSLEFNSRPMISINVTGRSFLTLEWQCSWKIYDDDLLP